MSVPSTTAERDTSDTCRLRYAVVERRCTDLGATNDVQRAELLGVVRQTVARWRNGETGVSLKTARRLEKKLGVRLDQLLES